MSFFMVVVDLVLGFIACIFNGWVLSELWKWFIITAFKSAPTLTVIQAIGVILVVNLVTQGYTTSEVLEEIESAFSWSSFKRRLFNNFHLPLVTLFMAWVFHDFIF